MKSCASLLNYKVGPAYLRGNRGIPSVRYICLADILSLILVKNVFSSNEVLFGHGLLATIGV